MLFCSQQFAAFFAVVFAAYWLLPWRRGRVYLLLAASYYFYASWSHWLALVVCGSTTLDYWLARGIDAAGSTRVRRLLLGISIGANLALLGYFKYANFFLDSLRAALEAAGSGATLGTLEIILPLGISFYTFEAISYTVDVYRRRIRAERNWANLMLFILFFPHLIAGPIVRGRHFLPQVRRAKRWNWGRLHAGLGLIVLGVLKKLAIADRMALFVDPVFASPLDFGTSAVWMAALAYTLQVYCDFSGYSDIAIGTAHLLGYKLPQNFDMPLLASSPSEFWRRWNITLSTWLRDYVYFPLGGSRGPELVTARNLMITMLLAGLWHGASWIMVLWGGIHGALLVADRALRPWTRRLGEILPLAPALGVLVTFTALTVSLALFRSPTFDTAGAIFARLFLFVGGHGPTLQAGALFWTVMAMAVAHYLGHHRRWSRAADLLPAPALGFVYAAGLTAALLLSPEAGRAFIYFQF